MANASMKRIAAQNERAIRNLRIGMLVSIALSIIPRLLLRRRMLASISAVLIYALTFIPSLLLYSFLVRQGSPRRDAVGMLLASGEDLSQGGLIEWSWDIIYVSWVCQVGSSFLGGWVWWLYSIIPIYAGFKLCSSFIFPMFLNGPSATHTEGRESRNENTSRRQEKLRKRQEKGDPRVKAVPREI